MKNKKINFATIGTTIVSFWLCAFVFAHALGMLKGDENQLIGYQNIVSKEPKEAITAPIILGFRMTGILLTLSGILFIVSFVKMEFKNLLNATFLKWALLSVSMSGTIYGCLMRVVGNQQGAALLFFFTILLYLILYVIEKNRANNLFNSVMLLPLYIVLLYTMGIPGWAKIFGGAQVIDRYVHMFSDSFIANLPGGTSLMIYVLGILELTVPALLIISFIKGEFKPVDSKTWLNYALTLSIFTFGMLCFGLAALFNFAGSANLVFYPIFTLLMLISINRSNKPVI